MKIKLILYIGLTVLTSVMPCKADFVFSANISRGIDAAVRMEMGLAEQLLAAEKSSAPKNTLVVLLENYIDFYSLILYDNPAAFERRRKKRLNVSTASRPTKHPHPGKVLLMLRCNFIGH